MTFLTWMERLLVAIVCAVSCRYYLHMLQLESYQMDGYNRWLNKHRETLLGYSLTIAVVATIAKWLVSIFLTMLMGNVWGELVSILLVMGGFAFAAYQLLLNQLKIPEKKPLAYTPRMKRLCAAVGVVSLLATVLIGSLGIPPYILFLALAYITSAAGFLMLPIEKQINNYYMGDAEDRLEGRPDLIKIGITGSYGKTSTKFILAAILSEKYDVLATPSSFNTPMGLTRVIREQLEEHHQVFLAEMGARHEGDIAELCELVHPQYGVLTSVGPQHLETFGSIEKVAETKNELMENLPENGVGFFAADGGWVDKLFEQAKCEKYRTGLSGGYLSMYAEHIQVSAEGSLFTLCDAEGGRVACRTGMLGKHNIQNIVLAAMVAKRLGLTMEQIRAGIQKTEPVEHRLQLIKNPNGMTIIDDAFNANPVGAEAALDVLRSFPGRKILVTPGMVEEGEQEAELNRRFGSQITGSADILILVGKKHTQPIADGALAAGFNADNLYPVSSLNEATVLLGQLGKPGDVVLFENDLPDNYNE